MVSQSSVLNMQFFCPACGTARGPGEDACANCGLIFASVTSSAAPAAAGDTPLKPGDTLASGRYSVRRALARGGMGAIYLADDHQAFGRAVAIKLVLAQRDTAEIEREARVLSTLRHPVIPEMYGFFQEPGRTYLVMEYVDGQDLDQGLTHFDRAANATVAGRPYRQAEVLRWGVGLCRALEYLASRQPPVVHHDIKPANLLLDSHTGEARLIDFGTASSSGSTHGIYGTPGYAPPEQYRGQSEPRSDVYALAATLYHLASDDDPNDHPLSFPQLERLGRLGAALQLALNQDVQGRPNATTLRRLLEDVSVPRGVQPIQLPDSGEVTDVAALARWCETHWHWAVPWLARSLPDQIERLWGRTRLAEDLRAALLAHPDDGNAALDAALTILDPPLELEQPLLVATPSEVDFGAFAPQQAISRPLEVTNVGRRYARGTLELPPWLESDQGELSLVPGQSLTLALSVLPQQVSFATRTRAEVRLADGSRTLFSITARLNVSRWRLLVRRLLEG
jgi:serine/threonine protein kinase